MRRRLIALALSGLVHAALVVAVIVFVRAESPPMLFVDLAHGLDLAEQAVEDMRRVVADARSRVVRRVDGVSRSRPAAAPPSPVAAAPVQPEAPAPPASPVTSEPVQSAPEPPRPVEPPRTVMDAPPTPPARTVEVAPSASAIGESVAAATARAPGGDNNNGRTKPGTGAPGAGVSLSDATGSSTDAGARSGARDGGALALAIPGAGGDPAAGEYLGYHNALRRRVQESLVYPPAARRRSLSGTALLDIEIDTSGKIVGVTLAQSSSHAVLDDAALEAVRGVSRVPFPPGVPPRRLLLRLPVGFALETR